MTPASVAAVTPEEYVGAIEEHSRRETGSSLYPGQTFVDLAKLLRKGIGTLTDRGVYPGPGEGSPLATLYTVHASSGRHRQFHRDPQKCVKALLESCKDHDNSHVLFLRGCPGPEWLARIGAACHTDPEMFNSHLVFRWHRKYFSHPTIHFTSEPIIRLRVTTIGSREQNSYGSNQKFVDELRIDGIKAMQEYEADLKEPSYLKARSYLKDGDSIVRGYAVLDEKHFIVEQELSICLNYVGSCWVALVMIDAGNDLSEGPPGPWLRNNKFDLSWTKFLPTIQNRNRIALKTDPTKVDDSGHSSKAFPQSARLQALDYGNLLKPEVMRLEPFYAISDLFRFFLHSEAQFLNVMEAKIANDYAFDPTLKHTPTISNLRFFLAIIDAHLTRLRSTAQVIKDRGGSHWASRQSPKPDQAKRAETSAKALCDACESLIERAESLVQRCTRGMKLTINDVMLAESRQAISQARAITRLTLVASLYIPLSFTTSFFGMNFAELGTQLSIWVWFATSVPVFLFTVGFLLFDKEKFRDWSTETMRFLKRWTE